MKKNEIYVEMLQWALSWLRNVQTHNALRKAKDRSCYYEAELVHNLMLTILNPNFESHDIHFLNYQAKYYYENCNEEISLNYNGHIARIKKLFELVPEDMKDQLIWDGPK